jgi:hypothetical protein
MCLARSKCLVNVGYHNDYYYQMPYDLPRDIGLANGRTASNFFLHVAQNFNYFLGSHYDFSCSSHSWLCSFIQCGDNAWNSYKHALGVGCNLGLKF